MKDLVVAYLEAWNITDDAGRRRKIDAVFADGATYTDPMAAVADRDGIDGFIGAVQKKFAGVKFVLAGPVDAHHDVARFTWHAVAPGLTEPVAVGFDVATAEGGRLKRVVGFLDKVPA